MVFDVSKGFCRQTMERSLFNTCILIHATFFRCTLNALQLVKSETISLSKRERKSEKII